MYVNNMNSIVQFTVVAPYFPAPVLQFYWDKILGQHPVRKVAWRGAINTALLGNSNYINAWAVNKAEGKACKLGQLKV